MPVALGEVPDWLRKRIAKHFRELDPHDGRGLVYAAVERVCSSDAWLTAWGTAGKASDGFFVAEPYLTPRDVLAAVQFARYFKLRFWIDPTAWNDPGNRTRLVFAKRLPSRRPDRREWWQK